MARLALALVAALGLAGLAAPARAEAHRDPCHRARTCPADDASYMWQARRCRAAAGAQAPFYEPVRWERRDYRCEPILRTRFAASVDPTAPRPDYPRPDLVRSRWASLNGLWDFSTRRPAPGWARGLGRLPERILVPFTVEAPLSGLGRQDIAQDTPQVWYRRAFAVPEAWGDRRVILNFGAVDWRARVFVNGRLVGEHAGGYTPFSFDITGALRARGPQWLAIEVVDPLDGPGAIGPRGKQSVLRTPQRIFYTRVTGIWQTVWLEAVRPERVTAMRVVADPASGLVTLTAATTARRPGAELELTVRDPRGRAVATGVGRVARGQVVVRARVRRPLSWSPAVPNLYGLQLRLRRDGVLTDLVGSYTGFRSIGFANGLLAVNGHPWYVRGVLDQGYWPDGGYTAPTDAALRQDVLDAKRFGFNAVRMHVKVADPRWYYWADRLGLLVVQDLPSAPDLRRPGATRQFAAEAGQILQDVVNHPSLAFWVLFNENWGFPGAFQDQIVDMFHALDPSRRVVDASGWIQRPKTDLVDVHDYGPHPELAPLAFADRPAWVGEYGGHPLPVLDHMWAPVPVPPGDGRARLLDRFTQLTTQIQATPRFFGYTYTQLYDVERELNGLETYDRRPKVDPRRVAAINLRR